MDAKLFFILTELLYFMYVISMTFSFVNTCVTHTSFTVFDNVVYSVSSAEAHAWSRIHFCNYFKISRQAHQCLAQMPFCHSEFLIIWKLNTRMYSQSSLNTYTQLLETVVPGYFK